MCPTDGALDYHTFGLFETEAINSVSSDSHNKFIGSSLLNAIFKKVVCVPAFLSMKGLAHTPSRRYENREHVATWHLCPCPCVVDVRPVLMMIV